MSVQSTARREYCRRRPLCLLACWLLGVCAIVFVSFAFAFTFTFTLTLRLLSKTNPDRLPQLCALIVAGARDGTLGGEALLALAEALTWVGRPLPLKVGHSR